MESNFNDNGNFEMKEQPRGSGYEGELQPVKKNVFNNKWLWIIVGVVLLGAIIFFSTVCFHEFSEATCTQPRTCRKCGKTEGGTIAHQYLDEATCTSPKKCWLCGATEGEALGHDFKPATEYSPATCSRCGVETGEKLRSIKEWGFYDIDKFSVGDTCFLVNIYAYDLSEGYIVCWDDYYGMTLENGWLRYVRDYNDDGKVETGKGPYQYTVYDNDTIMGNEIDTYMIRDRVVKNGNIIFKCDEDWFIPYAMLDTSTAVTDDEYGSGYIRVYLKGY